MKFYKAFLVTAALIAIQLVLVLGLYGLFDLTLKKYFSEDSLVHYHRMIIILSTTISSIAVIKIFRIQLNLGNAKSKIAALNIKTILYLLIIAAGLKLVERPFVDFSRIVDTLFNNPVAPFEATERSFNSMILRVAGALVIAPILEEVIFRKYIFAGLLQKYSLSFSILISSICFALVHLPVYSNLIPTFIFGVLSCIIYKKTKNIVYSIIFHFVANLFWAILLFKSKPYQEWMYNLNFNIVYWVLFVSGIIITLFGIKRILAAKQLSGSNL